MWSGCRDVYKRQQAIRVAKALLDVARTYTNKNIQLYFNDLSQKRIDILKEHLPREERNYQIAISSQDAGELLRTIGPQLYTIEPVSYTHLDVYKRQSQMCIMC